MPGFLFYDSDFYQSDLYNFVYDISYDIGYDEGYDRGESKGYIDGFEDAEELYSTGVFGTLLSSVDSFMKIGVFGSTVTFGTILSISFGVILLGLAIKIFLGG